MGANPFALTAKPVRDVPAMLSKAGCTPNWCAGSAWVMRGALLPAWWRRGGVAAEPGEVRAQASGRRSKICAWGAVAAEVRASVRTWGTLCNCAVPRPRSLLLQRVFKLALYEATLLVLVTGTSSCRPLDRGLLQLDRVEPLAIGGHQAIS
eukprot:1441583-Alexandrium_andersonii.AAC.1